MNKRWKQALRLLRSGFYLVMDSLLVIPFFLLALLSRFYPKPVDVGLGPEPLINNIYHKKALERQGYRVETFVHQVYFITDDFDVRADRLFPGPLLVLRNYYLFLWILFRYRCLYLYFNGGPLGFTFFLWYLEPLLYRVAGIRTVLMPYGGDLQEMTRSPNLLFKNAMSLDYPRHRFRRKRIEARIDLWTRWANHIVGGCEWVDYLFHWDTLMLAHFSIDTELWRPGLPVAQSRPGPFRIMHAPNHRNIKGTGWVISVVQELQKEGEEIELVLLEEVPNEKIHEVMQSVDLVVDQLVIGWYAMFALEAMSMEKPVICYLRQDLIDLYLCTELLTPNEMPIIPSNPVRLKETIWWCLNHRDALVDIGKRSREFVHKHHSIEAIGAVFTKINRGIGIYPSKRLEGER